MGEDALELGLIDEFGGIEKSIRHAAQLANLKKGFDVIEYPHLGSPFDALTEALQASSRRSLLLGPVTFPLTKSFGIGGSTLAN